jgi:hypothetical protein
MSLAHAGILHSFMPEEYKIPTWVPAWRNVKYQHGRGTKCFPPLTVESGAGQGGRIMRKAFIQCGRERGAMMWGGGGAG